MTAPSHAFAAAAAAALLTGCAGNGAKPLPFTASVDGVEYVASLNVARERVDIAIEATNVTRDSIVLHLDVCSIRFVAFDTVPRRDSTPVARSNPDECDTPPQPVPLNPGFSGVILRSGEVWSRLREWLKPGRYHLALEFRTVDPDHEFLLAAGRQAFVAVSDSLVRAPASDTTTR